VKCELSRNTTLTPEVFVSLRNAPLSETVACAWLVRYRESWSLRRAAERFQVAVTTAARWPGRITARIRTPTRTERRIINVRVIRRSGSAGIAYYCSRCAQ
jgi:hypothetical protein